MSFFKKHLRKLSSRKGQNTTEYILIIAMLVGAIFLFGKTFKEKLKNSTDNLFKNVDKAIDSNSQ